MSQTLEAARFDPPGPAYVMITCQDGSEICIMDELQTIPDVREVQGTIGSYDIVAKIVSRTVGSLRETIGKIRKIPEIRATTTVVCESSSFC